MYIDEIIQNPEKTMEVFQGFMDKVNSLQKIKNEYTMLELNDIYTKMNKSLLRTREAIKTLIVLDQEAYNRHKEYAKNSLLYDILLDGWSYDKNKSSEKNPTMMFIPYANQMKLIHDLQYSSKHIHIEKSRRAGASIIVKHYVKWRATHDQYYNTFMTHKDLKSLDGMKKDIAKNSTFEGIRWLMDMSIWYPENWRDDKKYFSKDNKKYYTCEKNIIVNTNKIEGEVLGKGTAVGSAGDEAILDEIDVVCDMYPNQADAIFGSFSQSVGRIIALSTYRSADYPFYKIKEEEDPAWEFEVLDWRENPTCNQGWYEYQCSKLLNDEVLVARELDRDVTKSRDGLIWGKYITDKNYTDKIPQGTKVIGADFGGGTSATVFVLGIYSDDGTLTLVDIIETTEMDEYQIKETLVKKGFEGVNVAGDRSVLSQNGAVGHDWYNVLRRVGIKIKPIENRGIFYVQASVRKGFQDKKIKILTNNPILKKRILGYNWKNDKTNKDEHSHAGDALCYLWRSLHGENEYRGWI